MSKIVIENKNIKRCDPTEIWDIFEEAFLECPQTNNYMSDDTYEMDISYKEWKSDVESVMLYWMNKDTIGGNVIWKHNYWNLLPDWLLDAIDEIQLVI